MEKNLSIIIPVYNGEKYIGTALSSLIDAKNFLKEVIIGCDHCTDGTKSVVEKFMDTLPITIVDVAPDLPNGPGNARQAGLDVATGEWVGFLDVDDVIPTGAIQIVAHTITELNEKVAEAKIEIPMIIGEFTERNGLTGETGFVHKNDSTWVHGKWYNRKFLLDKNIRFDTKLYTHEDVYFNNLVISHIIGCGGSYCTLSQNIYFWNQNMGSMTSSPRYTEENFADYAFSVMEAGLAMCAKYPKKKSEYLKILLNNYCLMYLYYMNFLYYHPDDINPEIKNIMNDYYCRICDTYNTKTDDIWNYYKSMVAQYPAWKENVARSYGPFFEKWTLEDFLFDKVRVDN